MSGTQDPRYHFYLIPGQTVLKHEIAFAYELSFSSGMPLSQNVRASFSGNLSLSSCECMISESDGTDVDDFEIDNCIDSGICSQLRNFVIMDYFSNE